LTRVIDLKEKAPDDADWARRLLATVLAAAGAHHRALELVGLANEGASYSPGPDEPVEELRARAAVLAIRSNRIARQAAIRILENLADRGFMTSEDRFRLAQLYEAGGDWSKAQIQIRNLLAADSTNQLYLAYAARALLRHGLIDRATSFVDALEKQAPGTLATAELKARLLKQTGRPDEAVGLLKSFVRERPDQVGNVAVVLEDLGLLTVAEEFYRQFGARSGQAQSILALAGFLGRRGRLAEAIDVCEKASSIRLPEVVVETMVSLLYSAPIDAAQCRRAAELIERELKQTPRKAGLLFHLGNIRSLEGRYEEAEEFYRQSLESDPANSGPLANLAWLLARRDGKGSEALELVARAIKLDGPAPDLLDSRAISYLAAGRSDLAIRDLENSITERATPLKYVHLAQAYLMADRQKDAQTALQTARDTGLSPAKLSPLERENYERLFRQVSRD
jgi:cellulose synthase operon protein C